MKLWYPEKFDSDKEANNSMYIWKCCLMLMSFKMILRNNINKSRWLSLDSRLKDLGVIQKDTIRNYSALDIANQYINNLSCHYDALQQQCYYSVSDLIKAVGTNYSLNNIIRLVEYGNKDIPPMNWLRHSFMIFTDKVLENDKQ